MPIVIVVVLVIIQAILVLINWAVYAALSAAFGIGGLYLEIVFIILAFTFIAASITSHWFKGKAIDWWYTVSAYWLGLVYFLFGGAVLFYFTIDILYHYNIYISPAIIGSIYFGIFFLLHLYGTRKSGLAEITTIKIKPEANNILWPNFNREFWHGKKIVFLSDVHLGSIRGEHFARRVVNKIQNIAPDLVLIGGDIFDGTPCDEAALLAPFKDLHPPRGIYYVTGNHEYFMPDVQHALQEVKRVGITILDNQKVEIGGIDIVGVDYQSVNKKDKFENVLNNLHIDRTKPNLLIKHEPSDLSIAEKAGISLGFFGHTHRGQVWPFSLITRSIYSGYDYGLKPHGTMQVYTSSGVGTWGPPLRLGTKSEIVVVEFVS